MSLRTASTGTFLPFATAPVKSTWTGEFEVELEWRWGRTGCLIRQSCITEALDAAQEARGYAEVTEAVEDLRDFEETNAHERAAEARWEAACY